MERGADWYTCIDVTGIEYSLVPCFLHSFHLFFFSLFLQGILDAREMNKEG